MFYKINFKCDNEEKLQNKLNYLYNYRTIDTKVSHRNRLNLFCLLMRKLIRKRIIRSLTSVIDIGCDAGVYAKIISDFGFESVLGVDVLDEPIRKAKESFAFEDKNRKSLKYKVFDAENIDTNKKYDFVLCTEVIEHTDNPTKLIKNIKDILTPKGVAIITLPNKISFPYLCAFLFFKIKDGQIDESLKQHSNYPFYKSIKLFRDSNLKIIETSGVNLSLGGIVLSFLYKMPMFATINRMDFRLSRTWPLKYFTQSFFVVIQKK